jgi:hypothetical protein
MIFTSDKKTENELQALYNYLEGEYKEIRKRIFDENSLKSYLGNVDIWMVQRLFQDSFDFKSFIKNAKNSFKTAAAIDILLNSRYRQRTKELKNISEALKATEQPKYIELASKMLQVHSTRSTKEAIDKKRAALLFDLVAAGKFVPVKMTDTLSVGGKKVTVKKEIASINKTAKKEGTNRRALQSKYKNISSINISAFHGAIAKFFRQKGVDFESISDAYYTSIRDEVIERRQEFISFLINYPQLKFIQSEKLGKVK